jgi:uncharacterized protein
MKPVAHISSLVRYPVKSLQGEPVEQADVIDKIVGDRDWGVFDVVTGKLLSAKSLPALLAVPCRTTVAGVELWIDETWLAVDSDRAKLSLSVLLGRDVEIRRATAEAVSVIDQEIDDGVVAQSQWISFETQAGSLFDSRSPLHLVSEATLASLDQDHKPGAGHWQRYRPNIVVEGIAAMAEDSWVDRQFAIGVGGLIVSVRKRTERCVLTSRAQPGGVTADRSLLRFLHQRRDFCVGIYLQIEQGGSITVGDGIAFIP